MKGQGSTKIEIIPITADIAPAGQTAPQPGIPIASSLISEDSTRILAETCINTLPLAIWPKLPRIDEKLVNDFNHEFYLYCQRKGINPMDYLFDEFGLVVCGLGIVSTHYQNYQEIYGKNKKKTEEKPTNPIGTIDHRDEFAVKKELEKL